MSLLGRLIMRAYEYSWWLKFLTHLDSCHFVGSSVLGPLGAGFLQMLRWFQYPLGALEGAGKGGKERKVK